MRSSGSRRRRRRPSPPRRRRSRSHSRRSSRRRSSPRCPIRSRRRGRSSCRSRSRRSSTRRARVRGPGSGRDCGARSRAGADIRVPARADEVPSFEPAPELPREPAVEEWLPAEPVAEQSRRAVARRARASAAPVAGASSPSSPCTRPFPPPSCPSSTSRPRSVPFWKKDVSLSRKPKAAKAPKAPKAPKTESTGPVLEEGALARPQEGRRRPRGVRASEDEGRAVLEARARAAEARPSEASRQGGGSRAATRRSASSG